MKKQVIHVLLIEDVAEYAGQLRSILEPVGSNRFEVEWTESVEAGLNRLKAGGVDVVLLDISNAGNRSGAVRQLQRQAPQVPVIVLSSVDDEELAVEAVHEGAQDYLVKGQIDRPLLSRGIRYAIERKQSELAVLTAEEKYRSIFENTAEGIFQTTPEGRYISANPALARIYGYDSAPELIHTLTDIGGQLYVEPSRRVEFVRLMQAHDAVRNFESRICRKDGTEIWISENVRVVRSAANEVLYYEGTVEDITERKMAEERLRESENLYHSLVENLPQNIFRKDLSERFTFANQRFCLTLCKNLDEVIGRTDFDFFPAELASKYQQDDRVILETGKILETIEEHQLPGGEKIYVNVVKTPLYDAQGNIVGLQGIFWDITEKKRAEERVRQANAELARSREELRAKNEQMHDDLRMAREIQQAILPQQYPLFHRPETGSDAAIFFTHRYIPTEVMGGDFFNIVALSETKAGVFISDVMGHGVRSALVTAILRALVEELTPIAPDPGQLMALVNRDLRAILNQTGTPMFTTAFYLVADLETGELSYANAGHPKPFLIRHRHGEVEQLLNDDRRSRPALGLLDESVYPSSHCRVEPGDSVVLFTDGLYDIDLPDNPVVDSEWLRAEVAGRKHLPLSDLFDELLNELRAHSPGGGFLDDICMVGFRFHEKLQFFPGASADPSAKAG